MDGGRLACAVRAIVCLGLVLVVPGPARADCSGPESPRAAFGKAVAVFEGQVVERRELESLAGGRRIEAVRFSVGRQWKGLGGRREVVLAVYRGDYGYRFDEGRRYLVYASPGVDRYAGSLTTTECSRTAPLEGAGADLEALGAPAPGVAGASGSGGAGAPAGPGAGPRAPAGCGGCGVASAARGAFGGGGGWAVLAALGLVGRGRSLAGAMRAASGGAGGAGTPPGGGRGRAVCAGPGRG
jgi:hypothetical protein